MQLTHLKYLQVIEKYGSMNKAAKELNVTQPTLSKAIQTMEKEIGGALIKRSGNGIELTSLGKLVHQDSKIILGQVENWKIIASNEDTNTPVTIYLTGSVPRFSFMDAIIDAKKNNPELSIHVRSVETDRNRIPILPVPPRIMVQYFIPDHLESAVKFAKSHSMEIAIIHEDHFEVFANSKNPLVNKDSIVLSDLKDTEIIMFRDPKQFPYKSRLDEISSTLNVQMWQEETLMMSLILDEDVVSLRPSQVALNCPYIENGSIKSISVSDYPMPVCLCLLYPQEERQTISEKKVLKVLQQYFHNFKIIDDEYKNELINKYNQ